MPNKRMSFDEQLKAIETAYRLKGANEKALKDAYQTIERLEIIERELHGAEPDAEWVADLLVRLFMG